MLILKIIGIVLLSVIVLALVLTLLVFFWPFSYRIKAHKDPENFNAAFRILWLLGLLTATVSYEKEVLLKVKVLGIPVYKLQILPTEEKTGQSETKKTTEETIATDENLQKEDLANDNSIQQHADAVPNDLEDNYISEGEFFQDTLEESEMLTDEEIDREIEEIVNDGSDETFENLPFIKKVKAFIVKIKEFILKCREKCYNIKGSIEQGIQKIKKIYKNIEYYNKVLHHPSMKPAWDKLWKNTKRIFKHIKPRSLKADIEYGSGDPASTMRVYGYYCMIYPFYGKKIKFTPDMENKVLNFDVKLSGRVQFIQMILVGWSLFTDKHVRRIVRLLLREVRKRGRK